MVFSALQIIHQEVKLLLLCSLDNHQEIKLVFSALWIFSSYFLLFNIFKIGLFCSLDNSSRYKIATFLLFRHFTFDIFHGLSSIYVVLVKISFADRCQCKNQVKGQSSPIQVLFAEVIFAIPCNHKLSQFLKIDLFCPILGITR